MDDPGTYYVRGDRGAGRESGRRDDNDVEAGWGHTGHGWL